jgi:hypothetical protein
LAGEEAIGHKIVRIREMTDAEKKFPELPHHALALELDNGTTVLLRGSISGRISDSDKTFMMYVRTPGLKEEMNERRADTD